LNHRPLGYEPNRVNDSITFQRLDAAGNDTESLKRHESRTIGPQSDYISAGHSAHRSPIRKEVCATAASCLCLRLTRVRTHTAKDLLNDIRSKIGAAQSVALPSSALSNACQYALTLWKKLTRFLEYPELELSTNLAENSMRPVSLGRKNWLHIGSPQAGPKVAAIISVVESCRRLQVPVRDYFSAILPGLADLPVRCLPDFTPAVWVARHS
jgi:hypothetical protein